MQKSILMAALIIGVLWPFQNCGRQGTETGNPKTTMAYKLARQLCERMKDCNGQEASLDYCTDQLFDEPGVAASLGLPLSSGVSSLRDLALAELSGRVSPESMAAESCAAEIASMACSSPNLSPISAAPVSSVEAAPAEAGVPRAPPIVVLPREEVVSTAERVLSGSVSCQATY